MGIGTDKGLGKTDPEERSAEDVARELLRRQIKLAELVRRYGPDAGAGLSNVLTGFHLGLVDRQEVLAFVEENITGFPEAVDAAAD